MKICVLGLWHLGSVTAACCARHFQVTGLDQDAATVAGLNQGKAPLFEPGLNELVAAGLAAGKLSFTTDSQTACHEADILWLTSDTPVDENDESDVNHVLAQLRHAIPHLPPGALVLISAQLPVGTCASLEKEFPAFHFACSPENLRLGKAIDAFEKAERAVVGIRNEVKKTVLGRLFAPFAQQVLFMRTESAEMVKHALNSFLALSVTFINEIALLCEHTGADAREVSAGLKSEARIGPRAYLQPGVPFAGGTLARDVVTLTKLAEHHAEQVSVIPAIKRSNDSHRGWALRRLQMRLGDLRGKKIAVLGLAYTPNTDTLRRSAAVELCRQLLALGAQVTAYDPGVKNLPPDLRDILMAPDIAAAVSGADATVVCTGWPEFRLVDWSRIIPAMRQPVILDAGSFLEKELKSVPAVEHLCVGRS